LAACETAWRVLEKLQGNASPGNLERIQTDIAASIPRCPYSLQRHELLDFFDTDANLSLGFTDVSPFVRGLDDDTDLHVLWRESWLQKDNGEGIGEPGFTPDYQRDELCPVPISKALKAREVLNRGWLWRGKESGWTSVRDAGLAPGMTILLPLEASGYDQAAGWTGEKNDNKHPSHYQQGEIPSDEEQLSSLANGWQSIAVHTKAVADELRDELRHLLATPQHKAEHDALLGAVPWHDVGKNHSDWQEAVLKALEKAGITGKEAHQPFAKFSLSDCPDLASVQGEPRKNRIRELRNSFRPGIAHEAASALAFRAYEQARLNSKRDTDLASLLAEYIIMSHHGRVRKVLRNEIPKFPTDEKDINTVRGVSEGDPLSVVVIDGQPRGCEKLSTDCRRMGRGANGHESYTRGVLRLLEHYGPFRLAYFEAIFRAADIRASIKASQLPNA
jgi:CRISPR-associated endonuclease/helicase Cas3